MIDTSTRGRQADDHAAEGELCTTLWTASTRSDGVLSQDEVDRLLGVREPPA